MRRHLTWWKHNLLNIYKVCFSLSNTFSPYHHVKSIIEARTVTRKERTKKLWKIPRENQFSANFCMPFSISARGVRLNKNNKFWRNFNNFCTHCKMLCVGCGSCCRGSHERYKICSNFIHVLIPIKEGNFSFPFQPSDSFQLFSQVGGRLRWRCRSCCCYYYYSWKELEKT